MKETMAVIVTLVVLGVIVVCSQGCSQQRLSEGADSGNLSRILKLIDEGKLEDGKVSYQSGDRVEAGFSQIYHAGSPGSSLKLDFTFAKPIKGEHDEKSSDNVPGDSVRP